MQFGSKPLFENISVKFGGGNRYGLIGANGSGKSTFMKILGGDLEPTLGNVSLDPNERIGKLRQDQFAFEEFTVLDTVIMGHAELWEVKQERDRIYAGRNERRRRLQSGRSGNAVRRDGRLLCEARGRTAAAAWAFRLNSITAR
jgi:ATPase subunit of ABC transporter with duplicated ATPase domains